jgi:hypothetical protein
VLHCILVALHVGSERAREIIGELQPVAAVQTPEMQQMGMKLQLNPRTGKFEVLKTDPSAGGHTTLDEHATMP